MVTWTKVLAENSIGSLQIKDIFKRIELTGHAIESDVRCKGEL